MSMTRRAFSLLGAGLVVAAYAAPAQAQIGGLGRALGRAAGNLNVDAVLRGDPPITTSLPDARWAVEGDRGVTYSATPPEGSRLVAGEWWPADYRGPQLISFDEGLARAFGSRIPVKGCGL